MPPATAGPPSISGLGSAAGAPEPAIPAEPFELDDDFSGLACAEVGGPASGACSGKSE